MGDRLNWPPLPGFRCHVTAPQASQGSPVWAWSVPNYPPADSWAQRWCSLSGAFSLVELHHLSACPIPTPSCDTPGPTHAWGSTPGLKDAQVWVL